MHTHTGVLIWIRKNVNGVTWYALAAHNSTTTLPFTELHHHWRKGWHWYAPSITIIIFALLINHLFLNATVFFCSESVELLMAAELHVCWPPRADNGLCTLLLWTYDDKCLSRQHCEGMEPPYPWSSRRVSSESYGSLILCKWWCCVKQKPHFKVPTVLLQSAAWQPSRGSHLQTCNAHCALLHEKSSYWKEGPPVVQTSSCDRVCVPCICAQQLLLSLQAFVCSFSSFYMCICSHMLSCVHTECCIHIWYDVTDEKSPFSRLLKIQGYAFILSYASPCLCPFSSYMYLSLNSSL